MSFELLVHLTEPVLDVSLDCSDTIFWGPRERRLAGGRSRVVVLEMLTVSSVSGRDMLLHCGCDEVVGFGNVAEAGSSDRPVLGVVDQVREVRQLLVQRVSHQP